MTIRKTGSASGEVTGVEGAGNDGIVALGSLPEKWAQDDEAALAAENALDALDG